jgi:hypothetical protein
MPVERVVSESGRWVRLLVSLAVAVVAIFATVALDGVATATPIVPTLAVVASPSGATPDSVAVDASGNMYIASYGQNVVYKQTPSGTLSVFAGHSNFSFGLPVAGPATSSGLRGPAGLAVDSAGDLYIADEINNTVEKVTPGGQLSVLAGLTTGASGSPQPGPATSSPLFDPISLAVDKTGNLYIADSHNYVVEKVTPSGVLSIFAGTGVDSPAIPGPATSSPVGGAYGVATDSAGNVYISTYDQHQVVRVNPAGTLSIIAGTGASGTPTAGPATSSNFGLLGEVAVDAAGNVAIADPANHLIELVNPSGNLSILAGNGSGGAPPVSPVPATSANLNYAEGVAWDGSGNLYDTDLTNGVVEEITGIFPSPPNPVVATVSGTQVTATWAPPSSGPTPTSYTVTPIVNGLAGTAITVTGTNYVLTNAVAGSTYSFVVTANNAYGIGPASSSSNTVSIVSGYWTVAGDGGVFSFGPNFYGSTGNLKLNQPVFAITSTADGKGYWFVARDGGVFTYGDGVFHGSVPALGIHVSNIVGMAADTATGGYWLVGSDGGVYAFSAPFDGSVPGLGQHVSNVVGIAATADGGGYYLVTSTGAVYAFGDAKYQGGANTLAPHQRSHRGDHRRLGHRRLLGGRLRRWHLRLRCTIRRICRQTTKLNASLVGISATTERIGLLPGGRRWRGLLLRRTVPRLHGRQAPERADGRGLRWRARAPLLRHLPVRRPLGPPPTTTTTTEPQG